MFCPNCGSQVSEGERFCPKCGNALEGTETGNKENTEHSAGIAEAMRNPTAMAGKKPAGEETKGKKLGKQARIILASAVGIVVLIAVIGSVVWWVNPEGRLNGKIEAAKKSGTASLDLSSFDTSSVKDMLMMFDGCKNLQTVYLGDGWTDKWIEYVKDEYPDINFIMK